MQVGYLHITFVHYTDFALESNGIEKKTGFNEILTCIDNIFQYTVRHENSINFKRL